MLWIAGVWGGEREHLLFLIRCYPTRPQLTCHIPAWLLNWTCHGAGWSWLELLYHILSYCFFPPCLFYIRPVHEVWFRALKCRPQSKPDRTDLGSERRIVNPLRDPTSAIKDRKVFGTFFVFLFFFIEKKQLSPPRPLSCLTTTPRRCVAFGPTGLIGSGDRWSSIGSSFPLCVLFSEGGGIWMSKTGHIPSLQQQYCWERE